MKNYMFSILALLFFTNTLLSQSFDIPLLFSANITNSLYYDRTELNDSTNFDLLKYKINYVIPLRTKAELKLKKLKIRARQDFLSFGIGIKQINTELITNKRNLISLNLGYSGIKAGLGDGVWVYGINAGLNHDISITNDLYPVIYGAFAKVKIKGLNKQNFIGAGFILSRKIILPFPVFGFRRKITRKLHLNLLLPVQMKITKKISKTVKLSFNNSFDAIRTKLYVNEIDKIKFYGNKYPVINYTTLKHSLVAKIKLYKKIKITGELGLNSYQLIILEKNKDTNFYKFKKYLQAFCGLKISYNLTNKLINSDSFNFD